MNQVMHDMIYHFICQHWKQFGYGPTLREISAACYTATPNIYRYLDLLEQEKLIARDSHRARSIILIVPCPDDEEP